MVFLNTGVLTSEHYLQPAWLDTFQGKTTFFSLSFLFIMRRYSNFFSKIANELLLIFIILLDVYVTHNIIGRIY